MSYTAFNGDSRKMSSDPLMAAERTNERAEPASGMQALSTKTVLCFGLFHHMPQGEEFEDKVKGMVPNRASKVIILSEQKPELTAENFAPDMRMAAGSLKGAFDSLHGYYGINVSIQWADNENLVALDKACIEAYYDERGKISENYDSGSADPAIERKLESIDAAMAYISTRVTAARSILMLEKIVKVAAEKPDANLFFVAGDAHVSDIVKMSNALKAMRERKTNWEAVRLNMIPQALLGVSLQNKNVFASAFREIGETPFAELQKDYDSFCKLLSEDGSAFEFVYGGLDKFARSRLLKIADQIYNSGANFGA